MSVGETVALQAFAKVNLTLEVVGKRADGYHELRSVAQCVSLADTIVLRGAAQGVALHTYGYQLPSGEENLCRQAAEAFMELVGDPAGVKIDLMKRIPSGRGLGGGSSNAAAVLHGLTALSAERPSMETLQQLAAGLGSDVPLFLTGGTSQMRGRGEIVQRLPEPQPSPLFVIAWSDGTVPTSEAYGLLAPGDFAAGAHTQALVKRLQAGKELRSEDLYNCFERPVLQHWPAVARVHQRLSEALGSEALLSGSGSAVFGLVADREAAEGAAHALRREYVAVVAKPVAAGNMII